MAENVAPIPNRPPLSQLWQLPVLLASVVLFGFGVYLMAPKPAPAPDYARPLEVAEGQIKAGEFEPALKTLHDAELEMTKLTVPQQARLKMLQADAVSLGQKHAGGNTATNHQTIVRNYQLAQKLGAKLDEPRMRRLADSLAVTGEIEAALEILSKLGESGAEPRQRLLKQIVTATLAERPLNPPRATDAIERLRVEPGLTRENMVWAAAREAQLLMLQNKSAVDLLLRRYAQLKGRDGKPDPELAEIMVGLGRAYLAESDAKTAERWVSRAREALPETDPLTGEALLVEGQVRAEMGNYAEAHELFDRVATRFAGSPVYGEAMVGKAEAAARLDDMEKALADYDKAAELSMAGKMQAEVGKRLMESLQTQSDLRFARGDYELALQFLTLQQKLQLPPLPVDLLGRLAVTHEQIARRLQGIEDGVADTGQAWAKLGADMRVRVTEEYASAAEFYRMHAAALRTEDDAAYGSSLWKSGEYFDRAGQHKQAIIVFTEFIQGRPQDPNRIEAIYKLAQSHQADSQFDQAIDLYQRLIDGMPKSREAYSALVPLARCLLAKGPKFVDRAEHVLLSVVTDHEAIKPESREYHDALVELGQLYYHRGEEGDFEKAIARLSEVVQRYGSAAGPGEVPELQFQLGDAYRKSVDQIEKKLAGSLPPSQRAALVTERAKRLDDAKQSFEAVIADLEKQDARSLTDLQALYLRNSYFYRADCAYDLRQFEGPLGSIELYNRALQHYEKHPSALIALMQIVNSYSELGQWDKARATNERAKEVLKRIPDDVFNDPNLPMNRQHWQRWLDWSSQLASGESPAP